MMHLKKNKIKKRQNKTSGQPYKPDKLVIQIIKLR